MMGKHYGIEKHVSMFDLKKTLMYAFAIVDHMVKVNI